MKKFITPTLLAYTLLISGCSLLETRIIAVTPAEMKSIQDEWERMRPDATLLCERSKDFAGKCQEVDDFFAEHEDGLTVAEAKEIKDQLEEFAHILDL